MSKLVKSIIESLSKNDVFIENLNMSFGFTEKRKPKTKLFSEKFKESE